MLAVILTSCGVPIVIVLPVAIILSPLAPANVIPPFVGVAVPDMPVNKLADAFALLKAAFANVAVIFCDAYDAYEYTLTVLAKAKAATVLTLTALAKAKAATVLMLTEFA